MKIIKFLKKYYWFYKRTNLRGLFFSILYHNIKFPIIINRAGKFRNLKHVKISQNSFLDDHVEIFVKKDSRNLIKLNIGSFVSIGRYSCIGCADKIIIEDNVYFAPYVHVTDRNHDYRNVSFPIWQQLILTGPIKIGEGSWLGYGSQVMPGVTIGKHCVIGAGSIVTSDIPDYSVAVGIPARVIKKYNFNSQKWESVKSYN